MKKKYVVVGVISFIDLIFVIIIAVRILEKKEQIEPGAQNYFNAEVIQILDKSLIIECTEPLESNIQVGEHVTISNEVLSTAAQAEISELKEGDNIRVVYTETDEETKVGTIFAIYKLYENGNT